MFDYHLLHRSWLRRIIEVSTPEGNHVIEYNGRGIGFEPVHVDNRLTARKVSLLWFVPCFRVPLGRYHVHIEVRVWPWLMIRRFALFVDGELVFDEQS
jgi:hypothetical protein